MTNLTQHSKQDIANFLKFANSIADKARDIARHYYRQSKKQWIKSDNTWVTEADCAIEDMARVRVKEHFPDHDFFGEEYGDTTSERKLKWCLDPIDGTMAFVYGLPTFGVLIALTENTEPIVGIIELPAMKERWCGARGFTTTRKGRPCRTNPDRSLIDTAVFATSIDMFSDEERELFNRVSLNARERRFGADCYAYGLLASGYIDVVMEADMKAYDLMALVPVVEGAGGIITDWDGKPIKLGSGKQVLAASNRKLHEECLKLIHSN